MEDEIMQLDYNRELAQQDSITYKSACLELFDVPFKKYKHQLQKDNKEKQIATPVRDYDIFCDMQVGLEIVAELIKYAVWRNQQIWTQQLAFLNIKTTNELLNLEVKIPQTIDDLNIMFKTYPWTIDDLNPEIFHIINLPNFDLILKLSTLNKSLYFSVFAESKDADVVMQCENDVVEMWVNIKTLIKKLLRHHIEIAKLKS